MRDIGTIQSIRARTCRVPIDPPVETASGNVPVAPLVLIDIETSTGIVGRTYLFTYTPLALKPVADLVVGMEALLKGQALAPATLFDMLSKRFRLLGAQGLVLMAISGIDMALWDALAKAAELPLARLIGGDIRPLPAYASLRGMAAENLVREASALQKQGFEAFKFKIGMPDVKTDLAAIHAVREVIGPKAKLMVDFNQSLSVAEAKRRLPTLDDLGLTWIEEPTLATDFASQAEIRRASRTPMQAGENWWGPQDAAKSIAAGATDLMMPDLMKIGGITGWQRTAALADAAGLPVSSHIFPEVSAHALLATPGADMLEYLDIAAPILAEPLKIENGCAVLDDRPGSGIVWNEAAVETFVV
ncbi:MAG: enolase C-terminal domain-like protein [Rhabdaerophilum sp.]